jgi:hypothetical protein
LEKTCWGVEERLVGGVGLRVWEGVGSKGRRYWLWERRIFSEEEGVQEKAQATEMVDGEWEECNVLLVDGRNYVLIGKVAMGTAAEFASDTAKVSL